MNVLCFMHHIHYIYMRQKRVYTPSTILCWNDRNPFYRLMYSKYFPFIPFPTVIAKEIILISTNVKYKWKMYSQLNPQELTNFDNLNVNFWSKKYVDLHLMYIDRVKRKQQQLIWETLYIFLHIITGCLL